MLTDEQRQEIDRLAELGNVAMENDRAIQAISFFRQAEAIVPEPRLESDVSAWIYTALGDAYFVLERFDDAVVELTRAVASVGGLGTPYIHLRLGEVRYELGDKDRAADELIRAWALGGAEIFQDEPMKYLDFLRTRAIL